MDLRDKIRKEREQHTKGLPNVIDELTQNSLLELLEAEGYDGESLRLLSETITKIVMKSPILGKVIGHHDV